MSSSFWKQYAKSLKELREIQDSISRARDEFLRKQSARGIKRRRNKDFPIHSETADSDVYEELQKALQTHASRGR